MDSSLFLRMSPINVEWLFDNMKEIQISEGESIIDEGSQTDCLMFVEEGVFALNYSIASEFEISKLGPGSVIGVEGFLTRKKSDFNVIASEPGKILAMPFSLLDKHLEESDQFAANFHETLCRIFSKRLRRYKANSVKSDIKEIIDSRQMLGPLTGMMESFKNNIFKANEAINSKKPEQMQAFEKALTKDYKDVYLEMDKILGDKSELNEDMKLQIGGMIQKELLPYILLTNIFKRSYTKPRGYAGDFLTIAHMYDNVPRGTGELGMLLDKVSLKESPALIAVQNRRKLLAREIKKTIDNANGGVAYITSMACGPAQELFDVYDQLENKGLLNTQLVDIDLEALAFVSSKKEKYKHTLPMTFHHQNLVFLSVGRTKINIRPQQLMYSIGLIDYFEDDFVLRLMNYCYDQLAEGGRIILGNFHPDNKSKAFQDHVLDWKLLHRTEEDMDQLYQKSKFKSKSTNIWFEEQRINLFAECVKT